MGGAPGFSSLESERIPPLLFPPDRKEDFPSELKEEVDELLSLYDFSVSFYLFTMINSENPFFREIALFALWEREDGDVVNYAHKMSNDRDKKLEIFLKLFSGEKGKSPILLCRKKI